MKVISHKQALRLMEARKATVAAMERLEKDAEWQAFLAEDAKRNPFGCMFPPAK